MSRKNVILDQNRESSIEKESAIKTPHRESGM